MKINQFVLTAIRLLVSAFLFFCGALLGSNDGQIIASTEKVESTVVFTCCRWWRFPFRTSESDGD
jgi:hypothetical protein